MDKQQAIAYIHQQLDQGQPCEAIVRALVDQLRAPQAMLSRFVAQTEAEYRKSKPDDLPTPHPLTPVKLPPWLDELSTGQPVSVEQPSTQQPPAPPADQTAEDPSDWMQRLASAAAVPATSQEPLQAWTQPASQPVSQPVASAPASATNARPSWEAEARTFALAQIKIGRLHSDIASELADRVSIPLSRAEAIVSVLAARVESAPPPKITDTAQAAEFVNAEYARGRPKLEITADLAARTGEPQDLTEKFVALTIAKAEKTRAQGDVSQARPTISLDNPELEKYVVSELSKNRKRSDIVMAVCERTGAEWSEAQRFVGQVSAADQTKINARKNRLIVPMCIGAIVLGFIFTIGTAYPMIYVINGRTADFNSMTSSISWISNYIQYAPFIFGTGIVLIAGGAIGLITALQSQME